MMLCSRLLTERRSLCAASARLIEIDYNTSNNKHNTKTSIHHNHKHNHNNDNNNTKAGADLYALRLLGQPRRRRALRGAPLYMYICITCIYIYI